ncbi:MAG TPA: transglycosylase SLT domain-containing protein [Microvirga sp.]|jgi:hypothetical protein
MFLFTTPPARSAAPADTARAGSAASAAPVVDAIRQGAEKTGVGFDYLLATAKRESALDPDAKARTSSASGLFQFIEQTWLGLIKSEGDKAGVPDLARAVQGGANGTYRVDDPELRQQILGLRNDPEIASVMAGALTQKNRESLTADLGREPTGGDLYIAHFLGARGASELIRNAEARPDQPAASLFPEAAAANRTIFYDRSGQARGTAEVYALLTQGGSGPGAAPAFAPDRPLAFATTDGPAFHGFFQSEARRGPVSDAVSRLWQTGRPGAAPPAAIGYFPNTSGRPSAVELPPPATPEPSGLPATAPLPPPRPAGPPLDLATYRKPKLPS